MKTINLERINLENAGFFRYRKLADRYLLTNETGDHLFLSDREFTDFIEGALDPASAAYRLLDEKNFLRHSLEERECVQKYRCKYDYIRRGTSLHIVIPTLRCNHRCLYCHASARSCAEKGYDMTTETARKTVEAIFQSPSPFISIEFQGGEPLLNWDIIKYIIALAEKKNERLKRHLSLILVSNLTLMTPERFAFLRKHKVSICTSLDGPKFIHDHNRPMLDGRSGYDLTTHWIKELYYANGQANALATVTRFSLGHHEEIILEYLKWGMATIPFRPVTSLGYAGDRRDNLGITAEEYIKEYYKVLDYLVELTEITGKAISERMAVVCLQKIFNAADPSYLDMRSPCGAGCGQLAYMHDGSVYTCDEARMLRNDAFKLGNVNEHSYLELMENSNMKTAVFASCIDGSYCEYCGYKPYCGTCPVVNWKEFGSIFAPPNRSFMCKAYKAMFDYIFKALQDRKKAKILKSWIGQ